MFVRDVMTRDVIAVRPETPLKEVARLMIANRVSGLPVVDADGRVLGVVSETDLVLKERGREAVTHRPLAAVFGDSATTRGELAKVEAVTAGQVMTSPAFTVHASVPLRDAAALMASRRVNRLPVVAGEADDGAADGPASGAEGSGAGSAAGSGARSGAAGSGARRSAGRDAAGSASTDGPANAGRLVGIVTRSDLVRAYIRPDVELQKLVGAQVQRAGLWVQPERVHAAVSGGIATLSGSVERRTAAEHLVELVSDVDGIVAVRSELAWEIDDETGEGSESTVDRP